jgi:hypothetical protein
VRAGGVHTARCHRKGADVHFGFRVLAHVVTGSVRRGTLANTQPFARGSWFSSIVSQLAARDAIERKSRYSQGYRYITSLSSPPSTWTPSHVHGSRTYTCVRHALTRVYARTCANTHLSIHPGFAHSSPLLPPLALSGSSRSTARSTTCPRLVRTRRGRSSGCAGACGPTCSSPSALKRCHTLRHHCRGHPTTTTALLGQDRGLRRRKGFRLRSSWVSREGESLTLDGCTESARIAQFACVRARARVRVCVCVRLSAWICLCVCVCACVRR